MLTAAEPGSYTKSIASASRRLSLEGSHMVEYAILLAGTSLGHLADAP